MPDKAPQLPRWQLHIFLGDCTTNLIRTGQI
jgi:hypothetical protein